MRILYLPNSFSQQRQHEKPANIYPVLLASEAEWYRKQGHTVLWHNYAGWEEDLMYKTNALVQRYDMIIQQPEGLPFLSLPHPDRVFTRAKEYTSGNYKYLPGTHILSASGCWHGRCSFCCEQNRRYEVRLVEDVISEIEEIKGLGFKEVFDDSGTFPMEFILATDFLRRLRRIDIRFSCNLRIAANIPFDVLCASNFRMLLFGIESANQMTLDIINKGVKVEDIIPTIKKASEAGLEPHICVVFGWEWETDADALNTLRLVHYLLRKGYAKTAQASFIVQQGIKGNESQRHFIRDIYGVWKFPDFWYHKLLDIHDTADLKYLWRQIKEGIGGIQ
jgi:radical SAM superfamily enzyme YgiQ (UPF0313 family)